MYKTIVIFFILIQTAFSEEILISAASSLKEYLQKNITEYKKINPDLDISLNLGGSGTLKRQFEQGGNIDIIFLADREHMIDLKNNNYIYDEEVILENSLVLIKNKNSTETKGIVLAIGDPKYVPAGKYASEALSSLTLKDYSLVYTKDVRSVLSYVELGEADYGIIYLTDSKILKNSEVVKIFSKTLHSPIEYSIGVSKESRNKKESQDFINFLKGKDWND